MGSRTAVAPTTEETEPLTEQNLDALGRIVDPAFAKAEVEFSWWLLSRLSVLGFATWATMPLTFVLAWYGLTVYLYTFFCAKLATVAVLQYLWRKEINSFVEKWKSVSPWLANMDTNEAWWPSDGLSFYAAIMALKAVCMGFLDLLESIDPDMDTMTPGNARQKLTTEQAEDFKDAWSKVYFVGPWLGPLGLDGFLAWGCLLITLWQVFHFCKAVWEIRDGVAKQEGKPNPHWLYTKFYHTADCANLLILAPCLREMALAADPLWANDRFFSFMNRLPEMLFQGWFTVSGLIFAAKGHGWAMLIGLGPLFVSVLTTYVAAARTIHENVSAICRGYCLFPHWFGTTILFLFIIVTTIRLIGLQVCTNHDLMVSAMQCYQNDPPLTWDNVLKAFNLN